MSPSWDLTLVFADVEETIYVDPVHFEGQVYPILSGPIGEALIGLLP